MHQEDYKNSTALNLQLPAIPVASNCSILPPHQYEVKLKNEELDFTRVDLPLCSEEDGFGSTNSDGDWIGYFSSSFYYNGYNEYPDMCPYAAALYARVSPETPSGIKDGTLLLCYSYLEQVVVNTILQVLESGPRASLTVNVTQSPITNESTAKFFTNKLPKMLDADYTFQNLRYGDGALDPIFTHLVHGPSG